jgi:hypothetical protein
MGFETINLNDVQQTAGVAAPLPEATYNLKLLSAKENEYQPGGISFDIVVADGQYARRRVFPTLPPPADNSHWSAQAAAKFLSTLGIEQQPGETVIEAFNRAASNGNSTFSGKTKLYEKSNGEKKPDLLWFSIAPAAQ